MQKPLIFNLLFSCKSKTHYHVKGALSESESFWNSEMAYWKQRAYKFWQSGGSGDGGGGWGEGWGGWGVKAAPIACLTFTFTRGPPFIQNKIRFVLLSYLPVDDKTFLLIMCFYVSLDWGKTNLD